MMALKCFIYGPQHILVHPEQLFVGQGKYLLSSLGVSLYSVPWLETHSPAGY